MDNGNNIAHLDTYDVKTCVENLSISEQIQGLSRRLQFISAELTHRVRQKHEALLKQASYTGRFDAALTSLSQDVHSIHLAGQSLKTQLNSHYVVIENQSRVLSRLHEISHFLRSASTVLNLAGKLKNSKDVLRKADILYALGQLLEDGELKDIEFIREQQLYVIGSQQKMKNFAQLKLVSGLQERNMSGVTSALKIFLNLNNLQESLNNLITTYTSEIEQSMKECFSGNDICNRSIKKTNAISSANKIITPGKTPLITTTQNFRSRFWRSLNCLIYDELFECCEQVRTLKDALEQMSFLGFPVSEKNIHIHLWAAVQSLLRKSFSQCPPHIAQALQEDLTKLLSSMRGLEMRLNGEFRFERNIFSHLEVGYISKCAANMKAFLVGVNLPSNETIDDFIQLAFAELSAATVDDKLLVEIVAEVVACGKELCTKLETQIQLSDDSKQVVNVPNIIQTQNTLIANTLHYYKYSVTRMLLDFQDKFANVSRAVQQEMENFLKQPHDLIISIIQQLANSITSTVKIILMSIHREPGLNSETISVSMPSMYMKELQDFILRSWSNHIAPFDDKHIVKDCGIEMSKQCIELFVHNLCIVRPLSYTGRCRLKNDCLLMEQALKPMCENISDLGKPVRLLRAMSLLIIQSPSELVQQAFGQGSTVPTYVVLFLLFGHADSELQSPHTSANWSEERTVEWMQVHTSEREKLELIGVTLQRYRDNIRRKNIEKYDDVYPLLLKVFKKALEEYK